MYVEHFGITHGTNKSADLDKTNAVFTNFFENLTNTRTLL